MSVGTKKITTQLLDLSVKDNFESVLDGTGKPLSILDSLGFGELGSTINKLINKVKSVVNKILSAIGNVLSKIGAFIKRILKAIGDILKPIFKELMRILGIPLKWLGNLMKNALKFIASSLGTLGGWLKDVLGLDNGMGNMKDFASLAVSDIARTGFLASIFGYYSRDRHGLGSVTDRFARECGLEPVAKAYRKLFYHGKGNRDYYDTYNDMFSRYPDRDEGRIYNAYYNRDFKYRNDYFKSLELADLGSIFTRFKYMQLDGSTHKQLIELSSVDDLDRWLPKHRRVNSNKTYEELNQPRTSYSNLEKLSIIRKSSSRLEHKDLEYNDVTGDGIINTYTAKRSMEDTMLRRYELDRGSTFERYYYKGRRPNLEKPLEFTGKDYTPSVAMDTTKKTEAEKIGSTLGIVGMKLKEPVTFAESDGITKTVTVDTKQADIYKPSAARTIKFNFDN